MVTMAQKIKMALAYKGISEAELARLLLTTPQAFNQKIKREKLSTEELSEIARALGAKYSFYFEFFDGTKI